MVISFSLVRKQFLRLFFILFFLFFSLLPIPPYAAAETGKPAESKEAPKVRLALSAQKVAKGDLVEMGIWLQGWTEEYGGVQGYQLKLSYDPALLKPIPENEGMLKAPPIFPKEAAPFTFANRIGEDGVIEIAQAVEGKGYFYGYGKIGTLTFQALKEGTAYIKVEKSILILPGNPGINIRHALNWPALRIGEGDIIKEEVKTAGEPIKKPLPIPGKEALLSRFKDQGELSQLPWATDGIYRLAAKGILVGMPDGHFYPNRPMTRAEFAKIAVQAFRLDMMQLRTPSFPDVQKTDWFYDYVETARFYGLIQGKPAGGTLLFAPSAPITRAEIAAILARGMKGIEKRALPPASLFPFTDVEEQDWARNDISALYQAGIITGRSAQRFAPAENATRAEISTLFGRIEQAGASQ